MTVTHIEFPNNICKLKSRLFNDLSSYNYDLDTAIKGIYLPQVIIDVVNTYNTAIFIDSMEVSPEFRNSGVGSYILKDFCNKYAGIPIFLNAGYMDEDEYTEFRKTGSKHVLERLEKFYTKNGFVNVNHIIGTSSESISMVNYNGEDVKI